MSVSPSEQSSVKLSADVRDVVMICEGATIAGGAEKVAIRECEELARRGIRVHFITSASMLGPELEAIGARGLCLNEESYYLEKDRRRKIRKLFGNPFVQAPIRAFLQTLDPGLTIVHGHTYRLQLSWVAMATAQRMGFRTVQTVHDYTLACPTSLFFNYREGKNCDLQPLGTNCWRTECTNTAQRYKIPRMLSMTGARRVASHLNAVVTISEVSERMIAPHLPPSVQRIRLRNPQELVENPPADITQSLRAIFVGRLTIEKGAELFLQAAREAGVPAVVVGDGPLRGALESKYPNAQFLGWKRPDEVISEIRSSRCLVMPSLWRETLGLSVADAMSQGVPVLCGKHLGGAELIEDGEDGLLFDAFASGNLEDQLRLISSDPTLAQKLGANAYKKIWADPPDIRTHGDGLLTAYRTVLNLGP